MKAIFGILSLVIVLAVVAGVAKKQLQAAGGSSSVVVRQNEAVREAARQADPLAAPAADRASRLDAFPGAADANATVPQLSRSLQEQARDRTTQALQQGMQRNERATP